MSSALYTFFDAVLVEASSSPLDVSLCILVFSLFDLLFFDTSFVSPSLSLICCPYSLALTTAFIPSLSLFKSSRNVFSVSLADILRAARACASLPIVSPMYSDFASFVPVTTCPDTTYVAPTELLSSEGLRPHCRAGSYAGFRFAGAADIPEVLLAMAVSQCTIPPWPQQLTLLRTLLGRPVCVQSRAGYDNRIRR